VTSVKSVPCCTWSRKVPVGGQGHSTQRPGWQPSGDGARLSCTGSAARVRTRAQTDRHMHTHTHNYTHTCTCAYARRASHTSHAGWWVVVQRLQHVKQAAPRQHQAQVLRVPVVAQHVRQQIPDTDLHAASSGAAAPAHAREHGRRTHRARQCA
jgi:hypothetical protein